MNKIYLPFYSNEALSAIFWFGSWVRKNFYLHVNRSFFDIVIGSEKTGQVIIAMKNNIQPCSFTLDKVLFLIDKNNTSSCINLSLSELFNEYVKTEGISHIVDIAYSVDKIKIKKKDAEALTNWFKTGDMKQFSKGFISMPYNPMRSEALSIVINDANNLMLKAYIECMPNVGELEQQIHKIKTNLSEKMSTLTNRSAKFFYTIENDPLVARMFDI